MAFDSVIDPSTIKWDIDTYVNDPDREKKEKYINSPSEFVKEFIEDNVPVPDYQQELIDILAGETVKNKEFKIEKELQRKNDDDELRKLIHEQAKTHSKSEINMLYVLAGSHYQYTQWTRQNNQTNCRYITGPQMLQGLSGFMYVSVGTYYDRKDIFELEKMLMDRNSKRIIFADDRYEIPDEEKEWR